jgi:hypothetical protein
MPKIPDTVFKFSSDKFDYSGDIPEDANAGNKFYGRDVAEYLCTQLNGAQLELDFHDEDWGWMVLGKAQPNFLVEMCIYNQDQSTDPSIRAGTNAWNVLVTMYAKGKILGFFPTNTKIPCATWLIEKLKLVLSGNGIKLLSVGQEM